jgi:hypothetical protein
MSGFCVLGWFLRTLRNFFCVALFGGSDVGFQWFA